MRNSIFFVNQSIFFDKTLKKCLHLSNLCVKLYFTFLSYLFLVFIIEETTY